MEGACRKVAAPLLARAFRQENQEVGSGAWRVAWGGGGHREAALQTWRPLQLLRCLVVLLASRGNQEEGVRSEGEEEGGREDSRDQMQGLRETERELNWLSFDTLKYVTYEEEGVLFLPRLAHPCAYTQTEINNLK